jgi:single-strand DNA-binding protein
MINRVILVGNLGADPEVQFLASGTAVGKFSLATSRAWKDKEDQWQEETEWHKVKVWGKKAEYLAEKLRKGATCYVEGRIHYDSYERDGEKKYFTEVIADVVRPIKAKGSGNGSREEGNSGGGNGGGDEDDFPF